VTNVYRKYEFSGPCTPGRLLFLAAMATLPERLPEVKTSYR
jgi:hypothetical protein